MNRDVPHQVQGFVMATLGDYNGGRLTGGNDSASYAQQHAIDEQIASVAMTNEAEAQQDALDCSRGSDSTTKGVLLMGYHTLHNLEETDLPKYVSEHNATLTFPEKLMCLLLHVDKIVAKSGKKIEDIPISWTTDGLSFVIRDKANLVSHWLPQFFKKGKFSSFTRKLYRWGFRQVNINETQTQSQGAMFFGNDNFQRDNKVLLANMRSITAAGRRREQIADEFTRKIIGSATSSGANLSAELSLMLQQNGSFTSNPGLTNLSHLATQSGLIGLGSFGNQAAMPNFQEPTSRSHFHLDATEQQHVSAIQNPQNYQEPGGVDFYSLQQQLTNSQSPGLINEQQPFDLQLQMAQQQFQQQQLFQQQPQFQHQYQFSNQELPSHRVAETPQQFQLLGMQQEVNRLQAILEMFRRQEGLQDGALYTTKQ